MRKLRLGEAKKSPPTYKAPFLAKVVSVSSYPKTEPSLLGKEHWVGSQQTWIQDLILLLTYWGTLRGTKSLSPSVEVGWWHLQSPQIKP